MKIIIFNWRDIKNPQAGGAEIVTHEISRRWVEWGNDVTLFTAQFAGGLDEEVVDGVKIIRRGGQVTVRFYALRYYLKHFKGRVDAVIDEINTLPFFTPLYVLEKKVVYFNQLAREVWFYEARFPLNILGYLLEPIYLQVYRGIQAMVISESTQRDLYRLGIKKVSIFPMAIYFAEEQKYLAPKEKELTLIFVSRLVKSKRPQEVIKAAAQLARKYPDLKVWLVGGGEKRFVDSLRNLAHSLGVGDKIEFKGYVSQSEKFQLMAKAHLIVTTSIREGWGLIVTEANGVKTPGVVYDVPGLRDVVKDGVTGLVVDPNPTSLAKAVEKIWENPILYKEFQENGYLWAKKLTWEKSAQDSLAIIQKTVG